MPKKYTEKLGKFEDFKFDSVVTAEEPDPEKLKRYVFGVLTDKARAQDARDEAVAAKAAAETERDGVKAELEAKGDPDLAKELEKERTKNVELTAKVAGLETEKLAIEVAEENGLTRAQAKYLTGKDEDELKASAEEFIRVNGIQTGDPSDEEDEEGNTLRRTPRTTVRNPTDPDTGAGSSTDYDYEAEVARIQGSNPFS